MQNLNNYAREAVAARERVGLSQAAIAKKLGMGSGQYISNVERGKCFFSREHYPALAAVFGRAAVTRLIKAEMRARHAHLRQSLAL